MDTYAEIHNTLASKYSVTPNVIRHIRSTVGINKWSKKDYELMLDRYSKLSGNYKNGPHRSHSIKWYLDLLAFTRSLSDDEFQYIINYG